jgi:hypothetical protein
MVPENWNFIHVTDIHLGSPRSFRFAPAFIENWNTARDQIIQDKPDLLLVGGDLTRDGNIHRFELEMAKMELDSLPFPYYAIPGNMDTGNKHTQHPGPSRVKDISQFNITSEQLKQYQHVFGEWYWTFVHHQVRFSGFCDMVLGSGLPEEEALWNWLHSLKRHPQTPYHVWIMHYPPFVVSPEEATYDPNDPANYLHWYFGLDPSIRNRLFDIFKQTGTTHVLAGHVHCRKHFEYEGISFDIGPSTAFPQWGDQWADGDDRLGFLKFEVRLDGLHRYFIPLKHLSNKEGYGPGGHVPPEDRDYSLAWEKQT